jgi:hypothetical protein
MLCILIVYFTGLDRYRVNAIVRGLHIRDMMEVGSLAIDRLEMRIVFFGDDDGVEPFVSQRVFQ